MALQAQYPHAPPPTLKSCQKSARGTFCPSCSDHCPLPYLSTTIISARLRERTRLVCTGIHVKLSICFKITWIPWRLASHLFFTHQHRQHSQFGRVKSVIRHRSAPSPVRPAPPRSLTATNRGIRTETANNAQSQYMRSKGNNIDVHEFSLFSPLALLGNKKWSPNMKVQQMENSKNKMGLKGCKWSSLNAQGTHSPLSHPILELGNLPFLTISPLG